MLQLFCRYKQTNFAGRFATRSKRFADAYRKGLNGKQAAWAAKKYKGHRTLPESLMEALGKANMN
jgi:hypothetical protein